jgi:serine/alanine adding enzyme
VLDDATPAAFAHGGVLHTFLVRPLPNGACDLTTPYGYGGPQGSGSAWREAFRAACAERRVVSEFVRFHPLRANHEGAGDIAVRHVQDTVTVDVAQDDDGLMAQMASAGRTAVRKAAKAGVEPRPARDLERFRVMYVETMRRVGAAERYLFSPEFFDRLERMGDGVVMLDAGCAAGLFLAGGGAMHYFLSASTDEGRALSATNAILFAAMRHAREAGLTTLHLGGGLVDGDSLQRFKQSMGAGRAAFFVGSAIHDAGAYAELCAAAGGADGERFPAYRR